CYVLRLLLSHNLLPFNTPPPTHTYTLSLHDALPISQSAGPTMKAIVVHQFGGPEVLKLEDVPKPDPKEDEILVKVISAGVNSFEDRKSTRLNSSHRTISYAVFCLKKKNININDRLES